VCGRSQRTSGGSPLRDHTVCYLVVDVEDALELSEAVGI